ncbi:MAG: hypothetical protein AB3N12_05275 [Ruegeria sp.]
MRILKPLKILSIFTLSIVPAAVLSASYKETYECKFEDGLAMRPTPERVVFSVADIGRGVQLHEVEIPKITTSSGFGDVKQDNPKLLAIKWFGENYTFTASGRTYASNVSRYDAIDMLYHEFSIKLNRKTMKAIAQSKSHISYASRDGFAHGKCVAIASPKD